jgi:hypothetical protein
MESITMIFENTTTRLSGLSDPATPFNPMRRAPNSTKQQSKAAAREKLHDLWMPCLVECLRQEERHGRPHTLVSLERKFATYVAKPKGFVQGLIQALAEKGVIQFFQPLPKDNLPKSPSRHGYLRCEGMTWGGVENTTQPAVSLNLSNENAEALMISPIQGV